MVSCNVHKNKGVSDQNYVVLTQGNKQATDDSIVAGPAIVEVGKKTAMGTPSGMAAMSMGGEKNMTMPTPSKSMTGSWGSSSATASASASPAYTGAGQKMTGSIAGVIAAGTFAAAGLI
ncbi:hypothetical protein VN97_g7467 [Penicillium thymicola]|uniref:Uncharacterized protein n=1 Tax=Penicillium thymicola TaxID=293382 RepID=A0AAI9TGC5_PENTH|nr:hypothetical protein VN97_g7467 [Penicillium thymicola]